jgi:hypothetical protein
MSVQNGIQTGKFGEWLTTFLEQRLDFDGYQVFFDHGDRMAHSNVGVIAGCYGERISRKNQLTQADILIANPSDEIILLIEIEERQSSPKKIIGDVFTTMMCNQYAINLKGLKKIFKITSRTQFIFAGWTSDKGSKVAQLQEVISPRIRQFNHPDDGISFENVHFIMTQDLPSSLLELQSKIAAIFP